QTDNIAVLHADILAAYRSLLAPGRVGWSGLPPDEPYIWDHLIYHLRGAGERAEVAMAATDPAWLACRIAAGGAYAAEADVAAARTLQPANVTLDWVGLRLSQWVHLFSRADGLADAP